MNSIKWTISFPRNIMFSYLQSFLDKCNWISLLVALLPRTLQLLFEFIKEKKMSAALWTFFSEAIPALNSVNKAVKGIVVAR